MSELPPGNDAGIVEIHEEELKRLRSDRVELIEAVRRLAEKCKTLNNDRWRLDGLYQRALQNTWQAKWQENEDEFDRRLNETVRIATKSAPPGEHDYMLKQLMRAQEKARWLEDDLRVVKNELDEMERKCVCQRRN